jgi:hypothetical protein
MLTRARRKRSGDPAPDAHLPTPPRKERKRDLHRDRSRKRKPMPQVDEDEVKKRPTRQRKAALAEQSADCLKKDVGLTSLPALVPPDPPQARAVAALAPAVGKARRHTGVTHASITRLPALPAARLPPTAPRQGKSLAIASRPSRRTRAGCAYATGEATNQTQSLFRRIFGDGHDCDDALFSIAGEAPESTTDVLTTAPAPTTTKTHGIGCKPAVSPAIRLQPLSSYLPHAALAAVEQHAATPATDTPISFAPSSLLNNKHVLDHDNSSFASLALSDILGGVWDDDVLSVPWVPSPFPWSANQPLEPGTGSEDAAACCENGATAAGVARCGSEAGHNMENACDGAPRPPSSIWRRRCAAK